MGAIIQLIKAGLQWGGPAALGYFFNDAATWIANTFNLGGKVQQSDGKPKLWFVVAVYVAMGIALSFVMKSLLGKRKLFTLAALCVLALNAYAGPTYQEVFTGSLLFSIAASVSDTKSIPYCPQFLTFNIGTVPSSMKIEVAGDGVIFAIDGTGITNLNGVRIVGELPSGQYVFRLADGYIQKNTSFTIANAHAGQLDVYGWSEGAGTGYVLHNQAKAFANAALEVDDFFYAAFPSAAATDTFTITWSNGKTETMTRLELVSRLAASQEVVATRYNVDNMGRTVSRIQFNGAADQSIYYTRWNRAKGTVRQTL